MQDDFSNPNSGWPSGDDGKVLEGYNNGEYQILARPYGTTYVATPCLNGTNVQVDVDVRFTGYSDGEGGIAFDISPDFSSMYVFYVSPDFGQAALLKESGGTWTTLTNWIRSLAIQPGTVTNHLTVMRNGSRITALVNSVQLLSVNDSQLTSGLVGLTSSTFSSTTNTDTRYDNFSAAAIPSVPTSGPTWTPQPTPTVIASQATDAVAYQINTAHSGGTTSTTLNPPLVKQWSVNLGGAVSYPLIALGKVFVTVATTSGFNFGTNLYALDANTGQTVWGPVTLNAPDSFSAAAYDASNLYVVDFYGQLQSFDAATGAFRWSTYLPGQAFFTSPPVAEQGTVYLSGSGESGTFYAVSSLNGTLLWTAPVQNGDASSPALSNDGVYVSYICPQVYKFDRTSGTLLWNYNDSCEGGGGTTPVYFNGRLYVRDFYPPPDGYLDAESGALLGTYNADVIPAFSGNLGFFLANHVLQATNLTTGAATWTFTGDGNSSSAPIVVNGQVYIGSTSGNLYALDVNSGQVVWSTNVGSSILAPDEQDAVQLTGLNAGDGLLVVPAGSQLIAYAGQGGLTPAGARSGGKR